MPQWLSAEVILPLNLKEQTPSKAQATFKDLLRQNLNLTYSMIMDNAWRADIQMIKKFNNYKISLFIFLFTETSIEPYS
jgi:hypothetical protein